MPIWTALALALLLAASPAAAGEKHPAQAPPPPTFSVVVHTNTDLRDFSGAVLAKARPYDVFSFLGPRGNDLLVLWQDDKGHTRHARLAAKAAAVVLGPPIEHMRRLSRLRRANLAPKIKSRLMAGCIAQGDSMWQVEMAWGTPQRSFMVNYFSDEQHFVYLTPHGKPVLLRFVAGALKSPLPACTRAAAAQVESPTSPR
jgi:hypothetical protein